MKREEYYWKILWTHFPSIQCCFDSGSGSAGAGEDGTEYQNGP